MLLLMLIACDGVEIVFDWCVFILELWVYFFV